MDSWGYMHNLIMSLIEQIWLMWKSMGANNDVMMRILKIALAEYGIKETVGNLHNSEVLKYFHESGFSSVKDDETSWCSAFMCWCVMKAGLPHTQNLMARSWLDWGTKVFTPEIGDIAVFWRESATSPWGHVGIYVRNDGTQVWTLGGNQNNEVSVKPYPGSKLLGYRRWIAEK